METSIVNWAFMQGCDEIGTICDGIVGWQTIKYLQKGTNNTWVLLRNMPCYWDSMLRVLNKSDGKGSKFYMRRASYEGKVPLRSNNVVSLSLRNEELDPEESLRSNTTLTKLTLAPSQRSKLEAWREALAGNGSVKELVLRDIECGPDFMGSINLTSITHLDLQLCQYPEQATITAPLVLLTTLTVLDIGHNSVGDAGMRILSMHPSLKTLCADSNRIGDHGVELLKSNTAITSLSLDYNGITSAGARWLARNTTITELSLYHNGLGEQGAVELATNTTLTTLDLGRNGIVGEGIIAIAAHPSITKLKLNNGDESVTNAALRAVLSNTRIVSLTVSAEKADPTVWETATISDLNYIGEIEKGLMRILARNTLLTNLHAFYAHAGVLRVIAESGTIRTAQFSDSEVGEKDATALLLNTTLYSLDLGYIHADTRVLDILCKCPSLMGYETLTCEEEGKWHNGMLECIVKNPQRVYRMACIFMMHVAIMFKLLNRRSRKRLQ